MSSKFKETKTIKTHNAVSVPATTGTSASSWYPCDGYDTLSVNLLNSAATNSQVEVLWSADGANVHGGEIPLVTGTPIQRSANISTKLSYFKVVLYNTDASARTMTAHAYLKS